MPSVVTLVIKIIFSSCFINKSIISAATQISSKTSDERKASDYAFVTLVTGNGEGYISGAITLAQSLIEVKSILPRYIMVTPDVSEKSRTALSKFYQIIDVKPILCNHVIFGNKKLSEAEYDMLGQKFKSMIQTFSSTCSKFHVFKLTKFKRILFMDSDTLVLNSIDQIFDVTNSQVLSAAPDPFPADTFNSGVMVITPNIDTYKELVRINKEKGTHDGGDQNILHTLCPAWHSDPTPLSFSINNISMNNNTNNNIPKCGRLPLLYNVWANHWENYVQQRVQYALSKPIVAHFLSITKPWTVLEYEKIKNFKISDMPTKISNDLGSQANLHKKWRELYQKATGDKTVTTNKILSQFLQN